MDTTKEYIKMCDCPEIQKLWGFKNGDFLSSQSGIKIIGSNDKTNIKDARDMFIWLPRQDQIQDIMKFDEQGDEMDTYSLIGWFNDYCQNTVPSYPTVKTPEQMWLNFYMKEKFNKKWTGSEWKIQS